MTEQSIRQSLKAVPSVTKTIRDSEKGPASRAELVLQGKTV